MKRVSKIFHIVMLVLLLFLMSGCVEKEKIEEDNVPLGEVEPVDEKEIAAYFPVNEGMTYQFIGEGNEYASFTREIKYVKAPYVQIHENNGGTISAAVYKISDNQVARVYREGEFYSDTNLIDGISEKQEEIEVILKAPIKEGTTWQNDEWKREIVGVDQTISVPAGTFFRVIKVRITPLQQDISSETYEYYAENIGLLFREFKSEGNIITSKLEGYSISIISEEPQLTGEVDKTVNSLANPDLPLLAYQLEHQLRSAFQAAYESYINLDKVAKYTDQTFEQILITYRNHLSALAVGTLVDAHVERLRQYYQAGEGEVTFPTHEVIKQARLLDRTAEGAKIGITLHKYYPAREWSGKAYDQVVDYIISLVKTSGQWKVEKVRVAE